MAKTTQQRSADSAAKALAANEQELRHSVRPGIRAKLSELMAWHEIDQISEAVQLLILNAHALGPEGSWPMLAIPRHDFQISKRSAQAIEKSNQAEARKPIEE